MHTLSSIGSFVVRHKFWSAVFIIILAGGGWWIWGNATSTTGQTRYVLGTVTQGTIISSVSGSGQVAASQQLDIKPKVSGEVIAVNVTPGQTVSQGTLIAEIDPTDAQKTVRDAQANLTSAQLSLKKLQEAATTLTITQQQNAIDQAKQTLITQYQSSYTDMTSTFLDLPAIITALQDVNLGNEASGQNGQQWNIDYYRDQALRFNQQATSYRDTAYSSYTAARTSYDKTFADFQALGPTPDQATIEKMLQETQHTTALMAASAKNSYDLIQFYSDLLTQNGFTPKTIASTQITSLNGYQSKLQTHITTLLSDENSLTNNKNSITVAEQTLAQTQQGTDPIDLQSAELNVTKSQNALQDAEDTLADYYIRAPFSGTISAVAVNKYDQAGSGSAVATIVTPKQLVDLSVNEVDAAKIKLGDKATLTFDAITGLTLTGTVAQIDPVGTVSSGVVSYDVKISFDAQNAQVKSGMTVNATIQTGVQANTLLVPQAAVKTQNGQSYVLAFVPPIASTTVALAGSAGVLSATAPQQIPVTTDISDDTNIQITSGLTDGEQIVTRTVTGTVAKTTTTSSRTSGFGGGPSGAGAAGIRIP